jgi:VWFA-related protein
MLLPSCGARRIAASAAVAVCLTVGSLGTELPAEIPSPQPTFRSGIEVVQIDVVVIDERGDHVRGLTAGDFEIFDRGKPQAVAAFEEVTHARADVAPGPMLPLGVRTSVATNQTVQSDRLVVMVIDDLHIWRGRTDRVKEIARQVLARLGPEATMAVLFTSGEGSTELTLDRASLSAAIEAMKGRQSIRRPNEAIDEPRGQGPSLQQFFDNMSTYKTLEDAAKVLGASDGRRKAFVRVSEGIGKDLTGVFDSELGPCEALNARTPCYHEAALKKMMESLRRANAVTYNIDPRGHVTSQQLGLESFGKPEQGDDPIFRWHNPVRQAQDGLALMAEASGGFAVVNTDDFTSGLDRIIADLDHYYLIGFYPADQKGTGYRPLDVRVPSHPEWTIRFRKGYRPAGSREGQTDTNESPLVALSAGALPATDLALALTAVPLVPRAEEKESRVALALQVSAPRTAVEEADGKLRDELTYEVIVVDEKKKKLTSAGGLEGRITLSPAAGGPLPDVVAYQVGDTIRLRPGRYQLRVSAMSAKLAKGGSVYLSLDVPDFRKEHIAIGGLAVGYAAGPRIAATLSPRNRTATRGAADTGATAPESVLPFAPTLDRTFAASDTLRVYFEVASREGMAGLDGTLAIVGPDAATVHAAMPFVPDANGRVELLVPLEGLAPGPHILRATVTGREHSATREIGFLIR